MSPCAVHFCAADEFSQLKLEGDCIVDVERHRPQQHKSNKRQLEGMIESRVGYNPSAKGVCGLCVYAVVL